MKRKVALGVAVLAAIAVSTVSASATAGTNGSAAGADHGGITRNTIGSPVAALRNGPFGSFGVTDSAAKPPYGTGSLGIEVSDSSTSFTPSSEKVGFGNEVDFYGNPVLGLNQVGFHVFQTGENTSHGGTSNMPNIRFEVNPKLAAAPGTTYSTLVWLPAPALVTDRWSGYLDATATGTWFLTGNAGSVTGCNQTTPCAFPQLETALNDGGPAPTIYTAAVGKGRDNLWAGAVDGLRINRSIYDFEAHGVRTLRAN
jgi:hypothetical protein